MAAFNALIGFGSATSGGERYESLAAMTEDSDLVVRGAMAAAELGPTWVVDPVTQQLAYRARIVVEVDEVLAGKPVEAEPGTIWLTFPIAGPEGVAAMEATLPNREAILYLKNIGDYAKTRGFGPDHVLSDRRLYRLVGDDLGIVWNDDGTVALGPSPDEWMTELTGTSFDSLLERARMAAGD